MLPASSEQVAPRRERLRLELRGRVQGVGFRPFVHRLAGELCLAGSVGNDPRGVVVEVEGASGAVRSFADVLVRRLPPLARIDDLRAREVSPRGETAFHIVASDRSGAHRALVLPDVATCSACRAEILDPGNRRHRYPFTNCTDCGPRFSIVEALPYDRARTTMRRFEMCDACRAEYEDPGDRRFHAQPNACPVCGPRIELRDARGGLHSTGDESLLYACEQIRRGRIVALKGVGGFQLLVDARDDAAVGELRRRKRRPAKPLALMCPSPASVRSLCVVGDREAALLRSPESPIVLMPRAAQGGAVAPAVAFDHPYLGVMLPYSPLHHILMLELGFPIVATSGNPSDEPIAIDNDEALARLRGIADFFLLHDRPIARRLDDSVVQVLASEPTVLRAARGYAPVAVPLPRAAEPLLALGGHQKSSVALTLGKTAVLGQHLGDLDTLAATRAFAREVESIRELHDAAPARLVVDAHPDYASTVHGESRGLPLCRVQHHLAHLLSCMAENRLRPPVLGAVWDGTGLGADGTIWGGEFLEVDTDRWRRAGHLRPFRLPGGDAAAREPRRAALGVLHELFGDGLQGRVELTDPLAWTGPDLEKLLAMLRQRVSCPVTTSAGRLFDAVAFLLGISTANRYEGEAAMRLQFAAERTDADGSYPSKPRANGDRWILDWKPILLGVLDDRAKGSAPEVIARKFHRSLAEQIGAVAVRLGARRVVLSGGCFQNRLLLELAAGELHDAGVEVHRHRRVPPNDGGLALGQLAAAALGPAQES